MGGETGRSLETVGVLQESMVQSVQSIISPEYSAKKEERRQLVDLVQEMDEVDSSPEIKIYMHEEGVESKKDDEESVYPAVMTVMTEEDS